MHHPSMLALALSTLSTLTTAQQFYKTVTAAYEALPTGAPPSPFRGLTYKNMVVTTNNTQDSMFIKPSSGTKYLEATDEFDFSITGSNFFQLYSLSFGCTGCVGTNCAGGIFPVACNVSAVSATTPGLAVDYTVLSYTPTAQPTQQNPQVPMTKITFPGGIGGASVHFSLTAGQGETNVFFDDLTYALQKS